MSDPWERDIRTIRLRPNLASHAPNVNKIILWNTIGICDEVDVNGIKITSINIILSKANNVIRRWWRCDTIVSVVIK